MLEELIKFSKTKLNIIGIVREEYPIWYYFSYIIILPSFPISYYFIQLILQREKGFLGLLFLVFGMTLPILLFLFVSIKYLQFLECLSLKKIKPRLIKNSFHYKNKKVRKYFKKKLMKYLKKNGFKNKNELVRQLEKEIEEKKFHFEQFRSIFSPLAIIILTSCLGGVYALYANQPKENILNTFFALTFSFLSIAFVIALTPLKELYLALFTDYQSTKSLIKLLEEEKLKE